MEKITNHYPQESKDDVQNVLARLLQRMLFGATTRFSSAKGILYEWWNWWRCKRVQSKNQATLARLNSTSSLATITLYFKNNNFHVTEIKHLPDISVCRQLQLWSVPWQSLHTWFQNSNQYVPPKQQILLSWY